MAAQANQPYGWISKALAETGYGKVIDFWHRKKIQIILNLLKYEIEQKFSTKKIIFQFFHLPSELRMRSLKDYNVPADMLCIEQKLKPNEIAALVDGTTQLESNEDCYVNAFRKMLHFEEVAESRFLIQFNAKNIRLRCVRDRQYCIPIDVSEVEKRIR